MYARPARLGARLNALGLTVRRWRGRDGGQREGNAAPTADPRHATQPSPPRRRVSSAATTAMTSSTAKPRALVWLRNDLRTHDNAALAAAAAAVAAGDAASVTPFYCFDPRFHGVVTHYGVPKCGAHRAQFLVESVADARARLTALGSGLAVSVGPPEAAVATMLAGGPPGGIVFAAAEPCPEERGAERVVAAAAAAAGGRLHLVAGADTLLHPADIAAVIGPAASRLPDQFTAFRTAVEANWKVRPPRAPPPAGALPRPPAGDPAAAALEVEPPATVEAMTAALPAGCPRLATPARDPRAALAFRGGETAALARLKHYLFDTKAASTYFETRNGMLGPDYSTKFSPWLAAGCLSARTVASELTRYEGAHGANKSTYWIVFELLWRDFFRFYAIKHAGKLFRASFVPGAAASWPGTPGALDSWKAGKTGRPLVDANMRELAATGFMSNRGRQNVASFLAHDLGVDWRHGAAWFESLLLDHDPASNYGNWGALACGASAGARLNVFNVAKQARDYDPDGAYVRHWLPELARLRGAAALDPHAVSGDAALAAGFAPGVDYPAPIPTVRRDQGRGGRGGGGGRGGARGGRGRGGGRTGGRYGDGGHGGVPGRR